MVSFYKGIPDKNNYRRFRIKTVEAIDDYAMLREVIRRRYSRLISENLTLPDLVLIDGGKGQLGIAGEEIRTLKIDLPVISIAKARDEIYAPGRKTAIRLKPDSPALQIIQRVRDEAHRFAVAYHHILRRKKIIGK
jgi:excinuclease ABC subunit C